MCDDFTDDVKRVLAARAGNACSNPDSSVLTSGPQSDSAKALNLGVAAHITAAAQAGPRYGHQLSTEKRRHADNGIWLCQTCAKLIDNDAARYSPKVLMAWKVLAEYRALRSVGKTSTPAAESYFERKRRTILESKGQSVKVSEMTPPGRAVMLIGPYAVARI